LAAAKSVAASVWQNISAFSMLMVILDPSGITGQQLHHKPMSHWQHSFIGKALMSKQCPAWSSLQAPQNSNFVPKQQAVTT